MGPPKMRFLDTKYYQRRREKILSRPKIEPTFCTTVLSIMEIGRKLPKNGKKGRLANDNCHYRLVSSWSPNFTLKR